MYEFECISSAGLNQGAAQVSAGDAQLTFVKINPWQNRVNCKDGLNVAPFKRSFGADNPFKDVVRVVAFRSVWILEYTECDPLIPNGPWSMSALEDTARMNFKDATGRLTPLLSR